jgi:hypothetical protein
MNNLKNKYNDYYSKIYADSKLKEIILGSTVFNKDKKSSLFLKALKPITFVLAICIIFTSVLIGTNAARKIHIIYKKKSTSNTSCIVPNTILEVKNKNAFFELSSKRTFTINEIENILEINFLNSKFFTDQIEDFKIKDYNNMLAFAYIKRNSINASKIYKNRVDSISSIDISMSFITTDASDEIKTIKSDLGGENETIFNVFEAKNCSDKNMDIYHIDSLNTDLYIYKHVFDNDYYPYWNEDLKLEINVFGFFEYNNISYFIHGHIMSRELIVDFINNYLK